MFRKINVTVIFLLPFLVFSQNFEQDLEAIVKQFDSAASVSIAVKVNAYDKKGGKLIYKSNCQLESKGKNSYSKVDNMEQLVCNGYTVQVDHSEKRMLVSKRAKPGDSQLDIKQLKQLIGNGTKKEKAAMKATLVEEKNGVRSYRLTGVKQLDEVFLDLDVKNKNIRKISYTYNKESGMSARYIVLDYTRFEVNTSNFTFDLKHYFTTANGKYTAATKYKTYKLITE